MYVKPYSVDAPWNRTVAGIGVHPESALYRDRLWNIGSNTPGNFNIRYVDFTYPVYETISATTTRIVNASDPSTANMHNQAVPFNPAWVAAPGSDAQIIILDPVNWYEYNFYAVTSITATHINCTRCNRITANDDNTGAPANYLTKANGYQRSRGIGIQYYAMLVRPEEFSEVGVIEHALSMPCKSTHCTLAVPPATKVEGSSQCVAAGIPEGMRFALNITETDIQAWLTAMPADVPDAMKDLLAIVARALRDYGWFITDTSGSAGFQFEANVSALAKWQSLGFGQFTSTNGKVYPQDALDGLMTQQRIYALVPSNQYPSVDTGLDFMLVRGSRASFG